MKKLYVIVEKDHGWDTQNVVAIYKEKADAESFRSALEEEFDPTGTNMKEYRIEEHQLR